MGRPRKAQQQENQRILEHVRRFREFGDQSSFDAITHSLEGYLQHLTSHKFFYVAGHTSQDLHQEALFALSHKAIPDYVEEKGPFLAFAKLCVRRHIITVLKAANNNRHRILNTSISIDAPVSDSDQEDGSLSVGDFVPGDDGSIVEKVIREENIQRLRRFIGDRLTPLEKQVFILYLRNLSYTDIVTEMNKKRRGKNRVDCKTIDNALCRIKNKAMELLDEMIEEARDNDTDEEDLLQI